ncbi:MAG: CBS domain-containing protein [Syntrophomonadaceae bacterium]
MKARELMTKEPRCCEPDHDLTCALRIMKDEDCGIVPVTRGNGAARVVGVVTDRDIALHLGAVDARPSDVRVEDVMTTDLVSCAPEDDTHQVSRRMQESQVRRVLVVDGDRLAGVISTADLARASSAKGVGDEVKRVIVEVSHDNG